MVVLVVEREQPTSRSAINSNAAIAEYPANLMVVTSSLNNRATVIPRMRDGDSVRDGQPSGKVSGAGGVWTRR